MIEVFVPPVVEVVEEVDESEYWVPPDEVIPIVIEIKEITVLGLAVFEYNQRLRIDYETLIIGFSQNSDEDPIEMTWNVTSKNELAM